MEVHIELAAEELFKIGPLSVTNSMFMMFVVMALILIVFTMVGREHENGPGPISGDDRAGRRVPLPG